jgi:hypothetical protein
MSQVTLTRETLKAMYNADATGDVQNIILDAVPDLLQKQGFVLNLDSSALSDYVDTLDVSDYNDTRLIEVVHSTASGDEAGHGFYLHKQGGNVVWYASPTKKGKAVRLVPVFANSEAEQHLVDLGYTALG